MGVKKQLAVNIKFLRETKGLSQEKLANLINMSPAYFRAIEHGTANPSLQALERIAVCLGTAVSALLANDCKDDDANAKAAENIIACHMNAQISAIRKALDKMDCLVGDSCRVEVESMRNATDEMYTLLNQFKIPL